MPKLSEESSRIAKILAGITDRWALAGALAAAEYRLVGRGTVDIDFLVEWHEDLVRTFEALDYNVRAISDPSVPHPHLLICRRGEERVDLIIPTESYQELALDRADGHVLTAEDVIVHKLIAWRPRDRDDVISILAAGHELDRDYIEHWAKEWDVVDRWKDATGPR